MRSIWKRKWIVIPVAAVILLAVGAVGAVALADPGDDSGEEPALVATAATPAAEVAAGESGAGLTQVAQNVKDRRAKLKERLERIKKRWADTRVKMTPADQAAFDQLQNTAKTQRETIQEARKSLAETLKQMRALVQKYRPATTTTSAP